MKWVVAIWMLVMLAAIPPAQGQPVIINGRNPTPGTALGRGYPTPAYYNAFNYVAEGDFVNGLKMFQNALRSGYRSSQGRWIDSICYYTMLGESYYQLGEYALAMEYYDNGLKLYLANPDWMRLVKYPTDIRPDPSRARLRINWGPSKRTSTLGDFPNGYQLLRGNLNNQAVLQQGGVVALPELTLVNVHEIVRCTSLALRRRREILGPICRHDELTPMLANALDGRVSEANHWSQAWVNVQRGLAQAGMERYDEATKSLQAAVVVAGQFDHPLTATALLELGKLSIDAGDNRAAVEYLTEAALAAAQFEQPTELEESTRLASTAYLMSGGQEPLPILEPVILWAGRNSFRMRHLQNSGLMSMADGFLFLGKTVEAAKVLGKARSPSRGNAASKEQRYNARYRYLAALTYAQQGKLNESDNALQTALAAQRDSSLGLFRSSLVDKRYEEGSFTERVAALLYEQLLADPSDANWQNDPLESFALLATDRTRSFENWFRAVLAREDTQMAIEVADRMRRCEFYSTLPMGGRLLSLRWLLSGPVELFDDDAKLKKQDLLTRSPKFAELQRQIDTVRQELAEIPISANTEQQVTTSELARSLVKLSDQQETLLRMMALKREPSPLLFPPITKTEAIQENLRPDELLLIYVKSGNNLHAFMLSSDKYTFWQVDSPTHIRVTLSKLYKAIGNQDPNASINADQFERMDWRPFAKELRDQVIDRQQFGFWNRYERLIVVPDDVIWHVPFELLLVPGNEQAVAADDVESDVPLIMKSKVRYLPLASLTIADNRPDPRQPETPVRVGALYPRNGTQTSEQFAEWQHTLQDLQPLPEKLPAASGILRTVWDRLVVLDDLDNRSFVDHAWSPAPMDKRTADGEINQWLKLPWGGPQEVLLPGFHTAAEDSLKTSDDGKSLFLASTALMATGAKTVLISRWRTGGQTSFSLLREYLQERERSDMSPDRAWQRAILVVQNATVDTELEPRVNVARTSDEELTATHPFFWAGYMLFDRSERPEVDNVPADNAPVDDAPVDDVKQAN